MRCFLAIEVPTAILDRLALLQQRLQSLSRAVRWTKPEQIHLTLKFFGDVPDKQVTAVCETAATIASRFAPFELTIGNTGIFPARGPARIVWVGCPNPPQAILDCQNACEKGFTRLSFKPENRVYHPHLTIGRVKDANANQRIRSAFEAERGFSAGTFTANELVVFQSVLRTSGALYSVISRAPLGQPAKAS